MRQRLVRLTDYGLSPFGVMGLILLVHGIVVGAWGVILMGVGGLAIDLLLNSVKLRPPS